MLCKNDTINKLFITIDDIYGSLKLWFGYTFFCRSKWINYSKCRSIRIFVMQRKLYWNKINNLLNPEHLWITSILLFLLHCEPLRSNKRCFQSVIFTIWPSKLHIKFGKCCIWIKILTISIWKRLKPTFIIFFTILYKKEEKVFTTVSFNSHVRNGNFQLISSLNEKKMFTTKSIFFYHTFWRSSFLMKGMSFEIPRTW